MCWPDRKVPSVIVSLLSILVLAVGTMMVVGASVFHGHGSVLNADLGDLNERID
jgi:hypothetical protein